MAAVTLKNAPCDLAIRDREFVVLAGADGSAIVRLIAGLDDVAQGEILFDDRRMNDTAPSDRDVAFVSHDYVPYRGLSVFENLAIGLRRRKFAEPEIKKRITAVASALGLESELEANAESLLPERRQLVSLARAMVRQPKVYLFDNPFADLRPDAARRARAEVVKLHQRSSATIVYATFDPAEALALGERTVILDSGVVQQDAPAQSVYEAPANLAVAKFFGEPPMNLVAGVLKQERNALIFSETGDGTITMPLSPEQFPGAQNFVGKTVLLGFRPEDVRIAPDRGFRALIERVERRGSETDLYLQTGAHALIVKTLHWDQPAGGGHRAQFEITPGKTHLFEPETGLRVTREP